MKIKYEFVNGDVSEVEVSEEIGMVISDSQREEDSKERKNRRYCYSLDALKYEGKDYAVQETPELVHILKQDNRELYCILEKLPEIQKRRILMLSEGLSMQEIARKEGAGYYSVWKSIEAARKNLKKNFENG